MKPPDRPRADPPAPSAETGAVGSAFQPDRTSAFGSASVLSALRELNGSSTNDFKRGIDARMPSPWRDWPWAKRAVWVPYLWLLVMLDYAQRFLLGLRWLARRWLSRNPSAGTQALEVVLWPSFFIYLSWVSNTSNPFYIDEGFPWPWVGVWLIALRYGALAGVGAALLLLSAWYLLAPVPVVPRLYFLGGAIFTLIAGEFGSLWGKRASRQKEATRYLEDKIERLTRRLYLLKVSHDELEYDMVERPGTLRDALAELHTQLDSMTQGTDRLPGAKTMLEFLAAFGQIEAGAFYEFVDGPRAKIRRLASIGPAIDPEPDDAMVSRAIETVQSVHLLEGLSDLATGEQLLAVFPLFDANGDGIGFLTINRLPFMAFNADNLRNIWVLVQSYSDYIRLRTMSADLRSAWPKAPAQLAHEFAWLQRLEVVFGIQSECLVWQVRGAHSKAALECIAQLHENASMAWPFGHGEQARVIALVPFISGARANTYQEMVRQELRRRLGLHIESDDIGCHALALAQPTAWADLRTVVEAQLPC